MDNAEIYKDEARKFKREVEEKFEEIHAKTASLQEERIRLSARRDIYKASFRGDTNAAKLFEQDLKDIETRLLNVENELTQMENQNEEWQKNYLLQQAFKFFTQ